MHTKLILLLILTTYPAAQAMTNETPLTKVARRMDVNLNHMPESSSLNFIQQIRTTRSLLAALHAECFKLNDRLAATSFTYEIDGCILRKSASCHLVRLLTKDAQEIGSMRLSPYAHLHKCQIGLYLTDLYIKPAYRGQGYATRATQSLLGFAFGVANLPFVCADIHVNNAPSQKATARAGLMNGLETFFSFRHWSITREQWLKQQRTRAAL